MHLLSSLMGPFHKEPDSNKRGRIRPLFNELISFRKLLQGALLVNPPRPRVSRHLSLHANIIIIIIMINMLMPASMIVLHI